MQENYLIQIKKDLQQITNMLILNGTLTECPGLVHGKIGIAIFFFHYVSSQKLAIDRKSYLRCESKK